MGALDELGYHVTSRVIDAKGHVPQHRERIFIVGFSEDNGFDLNDFEFTDPDSGPMLESILHDPSEEPDSDYTLEISEEGQRTQGRW